MLHKLHNLTTALNFNGRAKDKTNDIDDSAVYMSGSKDADGSEATESTINQQHYIGSNERNDVKKKIMLSIITTSYTIK